MSGKRPRNQRYVPPNPDGLSELVQDENEAHRRRQTMRIVQPDRDTIEAAINDPLIYIDDLVELARFYVSNVAAIGDTSERTVAGWQPGTHLIVADDLSIRKLERADWDDE